MSLSAEIGIWAEGYASEQPELHINWLNSYIPQGLECLQVVIPKRVQISELTGVQEVNVDTFLNIWADSRNDSVGAEARVFPLEYTMKEHWTDFSQNLEAYFNQTGASLFAFPLIEQRLAETGNVSLTDIVGSWDSFPINLEFQDGHGYAANPDDTSSITLDKDTLYVGIHLEKHTLDLLFQSLPQEFFPAGLNDQDQYQYFMNLVIEGWTVAIHDIQPDLMQYIVWFTEERQYEMAYYAVIEEMQKGNLEKAIDLGDRILGGLYTSKIENSRWFQKRKREELEALAKTGDWLSNWALETSEFVRLADPVLLEPDGVFVIKLSHDKYPKQAFLWQLEDGRIHCELNLSVKRDTDLDLLYSVIEDPYISSAYIRRIDLGHMEWTESILTNKNIQDIPYLTLAIDLDLSLLRNELNTNKFQLETYLISVKELDRSVRERLGELDIHI